MQLQTRNGIKPQATEALDLSTHQGRKEQLEILLFQRVQAGENIESCIQALHYLNWKDRTSDQLQKVWTEVAKEKSAFNSLQRVVITAFAILGMIAFFNGAFKPGTSQTEIAPSPSGIENQK